ncbi:hypothetical protein GGR04_001031 [Aureimonas pseudogalii]|uniref:HEAT repeat domain-containing protein n=1 Tax=Aureimonas pseudogalii TaxID=1744844 RepID=A0A7W6E9H1_9HYPH|nr:hypothetical protein [Aureimonas pseudogalii]
MDVLSEALEEDDPKVRIAAAKELLDRGYGKPVTMTADVTDKLDDIDDNTLDAAISALRAAIGTSDEVGASSTGKTKH